MVDPFVGVSFLFLVAEDCFGLVQPPYSMVRDSAFYFVIGNKASSNKRLAVKRDNLAQ